MAISHDTAAQLSHELVRLMKLFQSLRQHAPRLHPGVDTASYPILFNLHDGPRRVSDLADCVHSDVSTVSRQVTGLVTHGLVEKVPDPAGRPGPDAVPDQRRHATCCERLKDQRGEWFRELLADWSRGRGQGLHRLPRALHVRLRARRASSCCRWPRPSHRRGRPGPHLIRIPRHQEH